AYLESALLDADPPTRKLVRGNACISPCFIAWNLSASYQSIPEKRRVPDRHVVGQTGELEGKRIGLKAGLGGNGLEGRGQFVQPGVEVVQEATRGRARNGTKRPGMDIAEEFGRHGRDPVFAVDEPKMRRDRQDAREGCVADPRAAVGVQS